MAWDVDVLRMIRFLEREDAWAGNILTDRIGKAALLPSGADANSLEARLLKSLNILLGGVTRAGLGSRTREQDWEFTVGTKESLERRRVREQTGAKNGEVFPIRTAEGLCCVLSRPIQIVPVI